MDNNIRNLVKSGYTDIAHRSCSCCGSCAPAGEISSQIGYSDEELQAVSAGSNLGLGCGNPVALASLLPGERVLDLGSGAGFDCFLAANAVGPEGRVIGIDMTPAMIERGREHARTSGVTNVEFRLGKIEEIPVEDDAVDVIISNCVINLSPEKDRVFREGFRVLRPGGRMMISDLVLVKPLPQALISSAAAYIGCLSGAIIKDAYLRLISDAGFEEITIMEEGRYPIECMANDTSSDALNKDFVILPEVLAEARESVSSIKIRAIKPQ
jgi:arsenite methyltransferase